MPQDEALGVVHVVPAQQPAGQEIGSHTQAPPTQCWPAAQEPPVPH